MDRTNEYLRALRALDGLSNAILAGIHVYKREKIAEFLLVTDRSFTAAEEEQAKTISQGFLPAEFSACVKIAKRVIDEELVRLRAHFGAFHDICAESTPSGKKLDFLMQELNRETNTIGSKANNATIARLVVNMKNELEKIREQVQNIE